MSTGYGRGQDEVSNASGGPAEPLRSLLRVEGAAVFVAVVAAYAWLGGPWWLFPVLILAPDLSAVGYLGGSQIGALVYNVVHLNVGPLLAIILGIASGSQVWTEIGLIWLAHIGADRAFGYGLKYGAGFGFTHLGLIGPERRAARLSR